MHAPALAPAPALAMHIGLGGCFRLPRLRPLPTAIPCPILRACSRPPPRATLEGSLRAKKRMVANVSRSIVDDARRRYGDEHEVSGRPENSCRDRVVTNRSTKTRARTSACQSSHHHNHHQHRDHHPSPPHPKVYVLLITADDAALEERLLGRGRETREEVSARVARAKMMEPKVSREREGGVRVGVRDVVVVMVVVWGSGLGSGQSFTKPREWDYETAVWPAIILNTRLD